MSTNVHDEAGQSQGAAAAVPMPPSWGGWSALVAHAESLEGDPLVADLSDDQVVDELRSSAGAVASATARLLVLVGELVVRGLWNQGGGATTPAQWLSYAVGMAASTAREQVRVALALRVFTVTRDRFLAGSLSYSKVRAITRVGEPGLEAQLLGLADNATAAQLEHVVRTFRGLEEASEDPHPRRGLRTRDRGDGMTRITVDVPTDVARRADVLLGRLVDELDVSGQPHNHELPEAGGGEDTQSSAVEPLVARRADALVHGLEVAVDHLDRDLTGAARTTLVLHADLDSTVDQLARQKSTDGDPGADVNRRMQSTLDDEASRDRQDASAARGPASEVGDDVTRTQDRPIGDSAESGGHVRARHPAGKTSTKPGDGTRRAHRPAGGDSAASGPGRSSVVTVTDDQGRMLALSRRVLRQLACDASLCRITTRDGLPIDVGRQQRTITHALRRALRHRDVTCRFPGCAATRHLHAHHIVHWADGGPTDLANLVLLCGAHHRFLHANDWTITRTGPNRFAFWRPGAERPHPNRLPAVGGGQADSAAAAARHDPRGLEPPGTVYPDYDLDLTIAILQDALDRLPVAPAA